MLETVTIILIGLITLGLAAYLIGIYNSQIALSRGADKVFSNLEVVLKQRHSELPKLVDSCRAYMVHERDCLEAVTRLRNAWPAAAQTATKVQAENALGHELAGLRLLVENYPQLKVDQHFLQINARITELETLIRERGEQFNQAITHYNIFIDQFPILLLAMLFRWGNKPLLQIEAAQLRNPSFGPD